MARTAGVPLQLYNLQLRQSFPMDVIFDFKRYENEELKSISNSLTKLLRSEESDESLGQKNKQDAIIQSAVFCVLSIKSKEMPSFDRRHSVYSVDECYKPLYPLVLDAYREFFWDDIMKYVAKNEASLLGYCAKSTTNNNHRRLLFKHVVIQRCLNANLTLLVEKDGITEADFPGLRPCNLVKLFPGGKLPEFLDGDGMYVPIDHEFPAIDLIWKMGQDVWCVRTHVYDFNNSRKQLDGMLRLTKWTEKNFFLLYLSPHQSFFKRRAGTEYKRSVINDDKEEEKSVDRRASSRNVAKMTAQPVTVFSCLADLPWPIPQSKDWVLFLTRKNNNFRNT